MGLKKPFFITVWILTIISFSLAAFDVAYWFNGDVIFPEISWQWPHMRMITAICFLISIGGIIMNKMNLPWIFIKFIPGLFAFFIVFISLGTLYANLFTFVTGQEFFVFKWDFLSDIFAPDVRMALFTAINFLLIGILLFLFTLDEPNAAHACNIPPSLISYFFLISYILGVYSEKLQLLPIALNTSIAFFSLCIAIFMMYPQTWLLKVFTTGNTAGIIARQMMLPLMVIPIIIGWLRINGERSGVFNSEVGVILVSLTYTFCFVMITWITARTMNKIDQKRELSEIASLRSHNRLEILSDIAGRLLMSDDQQKIINEVCNQVMDFLNCEVYMNYLVDESGRKIHLNMYSGLSDKQANEIEWLDFGVSVCGYVARDGERIVAANIPDSIDPKMDIIKSFGIKAYVCYPLFSHNKVIGTLSFGSKNRLSFSNEDLSLMKIVTDQIAISIARIHDEKALRESEDRFRTIAESLPIQIAISRVSDGTIMFTNDAYNKTFGFKQGELIGTLASERYLNPPERQEMIEILKDKGVIHNRETKVVKADGTPFWILASTRTITFDGDRAYLSALMDIDQHKKAQEELIQLNRTLNALGKSSHVMMHSNNEFQYLQEICKIIIKDCGYLMVWVGYARDDHKKSVEPVAYFGFDKDYISKLNITWDDSAQGRGPTGTAIRTGKPSVCRNMHNDPNFVPWRDEALKRGYASSLVLPLLSENKAFGAISIYAREPDAFSEGDVDLLANLANDLAYGITNIRLRESEKEAAGKIKESEEKYRLLFDEMVEGFALHEIILDERGEPFDYRFISANPAFEKQTGLKVSEITGKRVKEIIPSLENYWIKTYGEVALSGKSIEFENYSADLNKHFRVSVFSPKKGYFATIFENITERIQAENEVRVAKEKLDLALENANIGIWTWDISNNILEWDEMIGKMFGIQDMGSENGFEELEKYMHDEDFPHFKRAIQKALDDTIALDTIFRTKLNSNEFKYIDVKARVEKNHQGKPVKMTGVCLDITAMKKTTEQTLFSLNEDLLRSNKELEQFAYVASHDLQEPLRMVSSFTQLLALRYKDKLDKEAHEFISFAVDGASRMQTLINDLLQFSRINTRGKELSSIDANAVIQQTLHNLSIKIKEKKAKITSEKLPFIYADEGQMIQLFQNLIDNAIKFCDKVPYIHIDFTEEKDNLRFSVSDNGIGIEPQYFDRIFQIFQRLHLRANYSGTGIGLAISKRIVERHGGKIWAESKQGEGTIFNFTIRKE